MAQFLTTIQAAEQLGISTSGVHDLRRRRVLPALKFGNAFQFSPSDVARAAKRARAGAGGPRKTKATTGEKL